MSIFASRKNPRTTPCANALISGSACPATRELPRISWPPSSMSFSAWLDPANFPGLDPQSLTVDSPVPFSLKQCWYDPIDFETRTLNGPQRDQPALERAGDAGTLIPPKYTPAAMGAAGPFLNQQAKGIRRQLNLMRSRLLDHRFDFILHPGPWEPSLNGTVRCDLDTLLDDWLGHEKPVTILDLSGVPSSVLTTLIGSILRIVYEALYWSREKTEGGIHRPLLVVMEEAHRYLSGAKEDGPAADVVKRIAKEGRKYGIGAMVVSQRPAEVDETILSQCGTILATAPEKWRGIGRVSCPQLPSSPRRENKKPDTLERVRLDIWSRRQESNLDLSLRRAEFYPLKYSEESGLRQNRSHALSPIRRRLLQLRFRCPPPSSVESPVRPGKR